MIKLNSFFKLFTICLLVLLKVLGTFSIKAGTVADTEDVPSIVQIFVDEQFRCAGVLLSESAVLTVAHCMEKTRKQQLLVKAGNSKLIDAGTVSHVNKILVHKSYNSKTLDMDVAVLNLTEPIQHASVTPAVLCSESLNHGDKLQVYGWGKIRGADKVYRRPNQLHTVQLKVIESSKCAQLYNNYRNISGTMLCAATPAKGAGKSDAGGPAISNGEVCGLVSWTLGYAEPAYPSVYTDISSLKVKEFIEKALHKL